ncbi:MAG: carbohydrate porin [Opitutales bacterium]
MKTKTQRFILCRRSARFIVTLGLSAGAMASAPAEEALHSTHGHSHPGSDVQTIREVEQPDLTGAWEGARESPAHRGITPYATYIGEIFTNHRGGIDNGSAWAGLLDFGMELDLEKLAGWQGATFFANAFFFHGNDVSGDFVGDFNAVSNLYTDTSFNFYNIFLQQTFGDADSFVKIGQIALDDDFMVSETSLLFLNAGFGPLPVQSGNTAAPIYALAAPGVMVHVEPDTSWFLRAGIYAGDAGPAVSGNQGFNWKTGGSAGWMFIGESGFKYGDEGASVVKLGGYYHSGDYERFSDATIENSIGSLYAVIDHQLIASDAGTGLHIFARGGVTPDDEIAAVKSYADTGLVAMNVFRGDDSLGLAVSWTHFAEGFVQKEGGRSSEIVSELTYQVPLSDRFVLQPNLQYIVNPQGGGNHAILTGLRAEITF